MTITDLPWPYLSCLILLLGLIIGSFLNVVIIRLPRKICTPEPEPNENTRRLWFGLDYLIWPPSHCMQCRHRLRPWHNIPILSWLWLRGRCAYCAAHISPRYPLVEAATALATWLTVSHFGLNSTAVYACLFIWCLLALSLIDWDTQLLPDQLTLPLLWLGLIVNLEQTFTTLESAIIGAVVGYLSLWLVFHLFHLITGKYGLGYGDFKLYAAFGAWLGWALLPQILLFASLSGAIFGTALILLRRQDRQAPMPFGPHLAAAGGLALFYGAEINQWYLSLTLP
jgi:leader peptidase (prepilin peptidase)/N-methyltransferase